MRKINTFIAILFLVIVSGQDFKYGLVGNFHQSSIVGVHYGSLGKYGGSLGGFIQFPLVENDIYDSAWLYLEPQLEYSMQGENDDVEPNLFEKQKFHHDYIAAQVYIKYFFHRNGYKSSIFLFAGPRIEYMVREDRKVPDGYDKKYYELRDRNGIPTGKGNFDYGPKHFGYGVSLGAGFKINEKLEAFIRFDRGFSKVYPDNNVNNTYNRLLAVGVSYYLSGN